MRMLGLTTCVALLVATPALADEWDFVLVNNAGKEIKALEIAPAGTATWQKNKIDEGVVWKPVKTGGRTTVHFDKDGSQCRFDLKATFADDSTATWSNINVCDNSYVTVRFNNSGAPTFTAN